MQVHQAFQAMCVIGNSGCVIWGYQLRIIIGLHLLNHAVADDAVEPCLHSRQQRQVAAVHRQMVVILWRLDERDLQRKVRKRLRKRSAKECDNLQSGSHMTFHPAVHVCR